MRVSGGDDLMGQRQDMVAYWDFNEPDDDRQAALCSLSSAICKSHRAHVQDTDDKSFLHSAKHIL